MKSNLLLLAGRVLLIGACLGFPACNKKKAERKPPTQSPFVVDVEPIVPRPFQETLFATGSLVASESVQLQSERAGLVKEVSFEEGKHVKKGEVLVAIDDSELLAQLARARAQLELAAAAESRQKNLIESRGISPAEYEQSKANLGIAKAEVDLIQNQLAKTQIRAPFDGVAGLRRVSVGSYLTPGTLICSFQDISSLKIDFTMPERYLGLVHPGQKVSFHIAGRSEKYAATVTAIEPAVDVATRSLLIRALVPNEETRLLPGSFAEVEVHLKEIKDAILIPSLALIPGLSQQTVFIHRAGQVETRKVESGLRTESSVQIVEGLAAGDELITSGILQLRHGMKVEVKKAAPGAGAPAPKASETGEKSKQ